MTSQLHQPADAAVVAAVLGRAAIPDGMITVAAVHLATPSAVIVGRDVTRAGSVWTWRGREVRAPRTAELSEIASWAVDFALEGWQDSDVALDLAAGPGEWVKIVRSGARLMAAGSRFLGGPTVTGTLATGVAGLREVAAAAFSGAEAPLVLTARGEAVFVDGDEQSWLASVAGGPGDTGADPAFMVELPQPDEQNIAEIAAWLGSELGGETSWRVTGSRAAGTIDLEVSVQLEDGWTAEVPATVAASTELVGVTPEAVEEICAVSVPSGFRPEGVTAEGETVALHDASGVRVILRHS